MHTILRSLFVPSALALGAGNLTASTFTTVAPGSWTSGATWAGGTAPGTDVDGHQIVIVHDVTVVNNDIKLIGGATFTATGVDFTMQNGNFVVEHGSAAFTGCEVLVAHGFNVQVTKDSGSISMVDCEVDIGQNFQNSEGVRYLENVCLIVDESFQNAKGTDTLINVCAVIGNDSSGNFQNDSDSVMHIEASEFHLPNGNFQNQSSASLSGDITALWLENGDLQNSGSWTAEVGNYCVSGQVTVPGTYLPAAEDCAGTPSFFDPCTCGPTPESTSVCEGDGSQNGGAECPCGNNGNIGEGCDNGSGSGGLLFAAGVPSVSNDTLQICATQIPGNAPGFFFYSTNLANGGAGLPFGNGLRCVTNPVRIQKLPGGGGCLPLPNSPPLHVLLGFEAGDVIYFQYWYRNPSGPCVSGSANTTNSMQVTWGA